MDAIHLHLLLNHIPILGSLFAALLLATGLILRNRSVEITALVTLVVVAAMTVPAYTTGEEAEHRVEDLMMTSNAELEEHEEHAELSLWLMMAAGALGIVSLLTYQRLTHLRKAALGATLVALTLTFLSMIPLALHGGRITHEELRQEPAVDVISPEYEID